MTQTLVRVAADISTTLTTKTAIGATTGTLTSGLDLDGVQLPTGTYGFTVDRNSSAKEHFTATLTGANLTNIATVTRGTGVGTSGLLREHRKGAEVIITDWVSLKRVVNLLDGTTSFDSATPLGYDGTATISTANQFATKSYVDGVAIAGGADSSTTVKGLTKMSVAPASATSPIAVGDNDGRVPTQDENNALVGNNTDVAVGTGNKVVTQTGLQHNAEKYAADAEANDTYVVTLSPVPTSLTAGMVVYFKANTINTGAATLNVNSLGAKAIIKGVSTVLSDGDILAGQFCTVIYDGTSFVLQNPVSTNNASRYSNGTTTKNAADASTTQNIAHGLGVIPKSVEIECTLWANNLTDNSTTGHQVTVFAKAFYNGTTQSSQSIYGGASSVLSGQTFTLSGTATASDQTGVITFDATNIIITWTKTNNPVGTYNILWRAIG